MIYFCSLYSILKKVNLFEQRNIFIYSIFTIIYFFISVPKILPQVKIKESIVITPQNAGLKFVNSVSNTSHTIRLVGDWEQTMLGENEDIPMNRQRFKISTSCGDDIYSPSDFSGHTEFSFSAEYGTNYNIQFLNAQRTLWDPTYRDEGAYGGPFNVYIDGQSYSSAINSTSVKPWFSYLVLQASKHEIDIDCKTNISFVKGQSCEPIIGSVNDDWPEISIIEGGDYLSFYDEENDDTLGNSINCVDFRSNMPKLLYDSPYYKDDNFYGILQAELSGRTVFDTVKINKVEDFELIVEIEPNEIEPGDSADIHLLQDLGFDEIEFPPEQLFKVEIIDGSQYGTIVAQNGTDTADVFDGIPQGFSFKAESEIDDKAEVYIKVSTVLDGSIIFVSRDNSDKSEMNKTMTINKNDAVNPELSNTNINGSNPNWIFFPPEENREIYGIGKVEIFYEDSVDHFELSIKPDSLAIKDTIAFTESAKLFVIAKNADSNTTEIDTSKMLRFEITSKEEYGTFISPNGDTLNSSQTVLSNISYGKAKAGKVRFAALYENPDSIVKCNIKVTLQNDTTINGEKEAVVLEQTLKIIMDGRREVRPILTNLSYDPESDIFLNNIRNHNRKFFRVKLTRGGKIVTKHSIKLYTEYSDSSGGHFHTNPSRPNTSFTYQREVDSEMVTMEIPQERIRRQNYGSFYSYSSGETFRVDSIKGMMYERSSCDTNSRYEYVASIWGDSITISLKSTENVNLIKDSVIISEFLPDLVQLNENENLYELVGTPLNHTNTNDPCRTEASLRSIHFNSHYGTQALVDSIISIAQAFHNLYPEYRLRINDMSLLNGGKFDVNNNWRGGHSGHRRGTNADIPYSVIDSNDDCIDLGLREYASTKSVLTRIIIDRTSRRPYVRHAVDDHYHIYVD